MYLCTYNNSPLLVSTNTILAQKLAKGDKENQEVLVSSKLLYLAFTLKLKLLWLTCKSVNATRAWTKYLQKYLCITFTF